MNIKFFSEPNFGAECDANDENCIGGTNRAIVPAAISVFFVACMYIFQKTILKYFSALHNHFQEASFNTLLSLLLVHDSRISCWNALGFRSSE